jgi:short-subunit dehydrogenase
MRVLLTGATGGIGSALAHALVGDGHAVLLQGRNEERLRALGETFPESACEYVVGDLTDSAQREHVVAAAAEFGVDTLCNNAGINQFAAFADTDVEHLITTNVTATLLLTQSLLPLLMQREAPRLLLIGSAFGAIGFPGYSAYCASKFALRGFAEALAREYADTALRVHYLAPRATATTMNDARVTALNEDLGTATDTPDSVAAQVMQALRQDRRRLQLGSTEALQARINAIAPGIVDRALRGKLPRIKKYFKETAHA